MQNFKILKCDSSGKQAVNLTIQRYINFTHFCQELHENFQFDSHDKIFYSSFHMLHIVDAENNNNNKKI